jgi:hypothetical protein
MSKNTKYSGQPIISQVINLLNRDKIYRTAEQKKQTSGVVDY